MPIEESNNLIDSQTKNKRKTSLKVNNKLTNEKNDVENTSNQLDENITSSNMNNKRKIKKDKVNSKITKLDAPENNNTENKRKPTLTTLKTTVFQPSDKSILVKNKQSSSQKQIKDSENTQTETEKVSSLNSKNNDKNNREKETGSQLLLNLFTAIQRDVSTIKELLNRVINLKSNNVKMTELSNDNNIKHSIDSSSTLENEDNLEKVYYELIKKKYKTDAPFSAINSRKILLRPEDKLSNSEWIDLLDKLSKKGLMEYCDEIKGKKRYKLLK